LFAKHFHIEVTVGFDASDLVPERCNHSAVLPHLTNRAKRIVQGRSLRR
jgi:hypothetical protein